ncbi:nucleotidyltransferase [Salimicrobium humidisoli]|uniref:tRNA(Met) cytidine acetate ligase n=1 Tax=Salimicrobium humidisoli TaxID=2029857 RepID=A0ABX4HQF4_9BACI|nr:nucleotidyltransferase [Salimicrobium humidisoli]PBB05298.1 hypothetical protein CKW00_09495 [Salimicrobium humidisoli]
MQASGIIVEYNPFHLGHDFHVTQARKETGADCIIAVMSGPFLQRGEPAIMDKWERARSALLQSVDLVVELPHLFAVQHGDYFSKGAVETLDRLNVSSICFGSEEGNIAPFINSHNKWEHNRENFDEHLTAFLDEGISFPEASRLAYRAVGVDELDLSQPNNILGYSYVKAIKRFAPHIKPETISRIESEYHDEMIKGKISSATSIRREIHKQGEITEGVRQALPDSTVQSLHNYIKNKGKFHQFEDYFPLIQHLLWTTSPEELRQIHGVEEGLEHRLLSSINNSSSFQEMMESVKTKRYTWTRLQRIFVHLITNTRKKDSYLLNEPVPYVRVLGMNKRGRQYLSEQKKNIEVPLVTQLKQIDHPLFDIDLKAQRTYLYPLSGKQRVESYHREKLPPLFI